MLGIIVHSHGDGVWRDLQGRQVIHLGNEAPPIQIAALDGGTVAGRPSVAIRLDLPDGRTVVAETSLALLVGAAELLLVHYGEEVRRNAPQAG